MTKSRRHKPRITGTIISPAPMRREMAGLSDSSSLMIEEKNKEKPKMKHKRAITTTRLLKKVNKG
jgi:hypothetical protein